MNLRDSRKDADWMLEDCMHVYGMNPDEHRNCCKNKERTEVKKRVQEQIKYLRNLKEKLKNEIH